MAAGESGERMTSRRGGSEGESPALRDQHPTNQREFQFRAQFAKHVDKVASQSLAAKQRHTPAGARGDKLLVARRTAPVVKRHGRSRYNPNVELDKPRTQASEGLRQPA